MEIETTFCYFSIYTNILIFKAFIKEYYGWNKIFDTHAGNRRNGVWPFLLS